MRSQVRRLTALLALLLVGACGPFYDTQQSTLVPLPAAPPPAPGSGGVGVDLGANVPTVVGPPGGMTRPSGVAVPLAQPEGALGVRLADFLALRGWLALGLGEQRRQITGTIDAPRSSAWVVGIGPSFRLLLAESYAYVDIAPTVGATLLPSNFRITVTDGGSAPRTYDASYYEVMPFFALTARGGVRPTEWLTIRAGLTVRTQPHNEDSFSTSLRPVSSVSTGPIGLVVHGGFQVDVLDELGVRAEVQWPAVGLGLVYGPIVGVAVQGRIDGSRADPFGAVL